MTFVDDLKRGKKAEELVRAKLEKYGYFIENTNRDIKWDLQCQKPPFTLEIKNDEYAKKSGNLAIEFFNSKKNKPSGLMATQADIWVHLAFDKIYIATVASLREFLNQKMPLRVIQNGGDGNASLYLYKFEDIKSIFKTLTKKNFKEVLNELDKQVV